MGDERFVGTWELVSTETRDADGNVTGESLPRWVGQLVYTADGYMSAHLMGPDRPVFASADRLAAPPEQRQAAFDTYVGYYGPYRVDDAAGEVIHHVLGAASPTMVGTDQHRRFTLEGDRLVLSPPPREPGGGRSYLTWRRAAPR